MLNSSVSKRLLLIGCIIFSGMASIFLVAWQAGLLYESKNGFSRNSHLLSLRLSAVANKEKEVTAIIGHTPSSLYFQYTNPNQSLITDWKLEKFRKITFDINSPYKKETFFSTQIDSPNVSILMGNSRTVLTGKIPGGKFLTQPVSWSFIRGTPVSKQTLILRGFEPFKNNDPVFIKAGLYNQNIYKAKKNIYELNDGGIATDGYLHYDSLTKQVTYVFLYRNGFVTMDTNLNIIYKGKTIDTLNSFQIKARGVRTIEGSAYTSYTPSKIVNRVNCVYNGILFNQSPLMADNENKEIFNKNSAIDIYDLKNGNYVGSFYIPAYNNEKMDQFRVYGKSIIVLYESYIVLYTIETDKTKTS